MGVAKWLGSLGQYPIPNQTKQKQEDHQYYTNYEEEYESGGNEGSWNKVIVSKWALTLGSVCSLSGELA